VTEAFELSEMSECAAHAARAAGNVIQGFCGNEVEVFSKKGGDSLASQVVTEVDRKAQDAILEVLRPNMDLYNLALLTEETEDDGSRFEKEYFWCIDPLDGTLAFSEGENGYAVSIGLVDREGSPVLGVVYDPSLDVLWQAGEALGVFRNGEAWKPNQQSDMLTVAYDRSFETHPRFAESLDLLEAYAQTNGLKGVVASQHGGSVLNACHALENSPGCHFKFPKSGEGGGSLWDYAATACIFKEAGVVVSDMFGNPLDLNRADSTFMNHRGVVYATDAKLAEQVCGLCT
jgi:3'-phosphoadenosine 5'-phosphosulfate (PAPS) 3'-phosphatase